MEFTANEFKQKYFDMQSSGDWSEVRDLHSVVSGLKSAFTWAAANGIETVR